MNKYRCHVTSRKSFEGDDLAELIERVLASGMATLQSRGEETRFMRVAVAEGDEYVTRQFYKLQYTTAYNGSSVRCTATREGGDKEFKPAIYEWLSKPIAGDWAAVAAGIAEDFLVRHITRRLLA